MLARQPYSSDVRFFFEISCKGNSARQAKSSRFHRDYYSVGCGGFFPNFASYSLANFSARVGSHWKHCDSARLCSSHQSPFALNSSAALVLHMLHSSSGMPCSVHHQPPWLWPVCETTVGSSVAVVSLGCWPHPIASSTGEARKVVSKIP